MSTAPENYPWYTIVDGDELEQGDIIENCPVFTPPADLQPANTGTTDFRWEERDLIVMSQSCDLVKGQEKIEEVLFCPVYQQSVLQLKKDQMERARKGGLPGYHLIAASELADHKREIRVVEFRRVFTLPLAFVRTRAAQNSRIRLMPPYREHLSQAFARFFMRVGLPVDIAPFK